MPEIELSGGEAAFVEVVGIGATVLAAILAAGAIVQSGRQGRKALTAIARERRLDFELDVLKEHTGYLLLHATQGDRDRQAMLRLSLLPSDGLGLCSTRYKFDGQAAYRRLEQKVEPQIGNPIDEAKMPDGRAVREHMQDEVRTAIRTRLDERGE